MSVESHRAFPLALKTEVHTCVFHLLVPQSWERGRAVSSDWYLGFRLSLWGGSPPGGTPPVDLPCLAFLNLGDSCSSVTQNVGECVGKVRSSPPLAPGSQNLAWGGWLHVAGGREDRHICHTGLGSWAEWGDTPAGGLRAGECETCQRSRGAPEMDGRGRGP